ncbi:uncharacterized protein LOC114755749 [Neltuma alba]|uniref:uncharacterized protein LOC114755749 n=1 Tax=Neltuma alba TaxID=207710 RepID=UPI0010A371F6|nr:uncharacterized protein LOC114755749 [Prosopis alba]
MQKDNSDVHKKLEELTLKNTDITSHLTQLSNVVNDMQAKSGDSIPCNTVINPKALNAIFLKSGRKVHFEDKRVDKDAFEREIESSSLTSMKLGKSESSKEEELLRRKRSQESKDAQEEENPMEGSKCKGKQRKNKAGTSMHGALSNEGKKVNLNELPFPQSYLQGRTTIPKALLDLGAAINVIPRSMFESLQIKSLKPTTMMLQLDRTDRTMRYPHGFLEDILVKVKDLVIPADFYVLDMPNEQGGDGTLILGRAFLRTANTNIDMQKGSITMFVGDKFAYFNMYEQMKQPHEDYPICDVNFVNGLFID